MWHQRERNVWPPAESMACRKQVVYSISEVWDCAGPAMALEGIPEVVRSQDLGGMDGVMVDDAVGMDDLEVHN